MQTLHDSILISAPLSTVVAVARDNARFPEFMGDVQSLAVTERSADGNRVVSDWVGVVPRFHVTVRWTEEDIWTTEPETGGATTCTFRQLAGDYDTFFGVWRFAAAEEDAGATRFDSELTYALEIPLVGGIIQGIIKKTMENNLRATLAAIKTRSEEARSKNQ